MNSYELQLRQALAAMQAPATLTQRTAQAQTLAVLLRPDNVAILVYILDETRRDAVSVLNLVVEQASPDNPAWSRAAEHSQYLFELLQASGTSCPDEGAPHGHAAPQPAPVPVMQPAPVPIPSGVYRLTHPDNSTTFYQVGTNKSMGFDFMVKWAERRAEFPEGPR